MPHQPIPARTLRIAFVSAWLILAAVLVLILLSAPLSAPLSAKQLMLSIGLLHNALALAWLSHTGFDRALQAPHQPILAAEQPSTSPQGRAILAQLQPIRDLSRWQRHHDLAALGQAALLLISLAGILFDQPHAYLGLLIGTAASIWTLALARQAEFEKRGAELARRLGASSWRCTHGPQTGETQSSEYARNLVQQEQAWLIERQGETLRLTQASATVPALLRQSDKPFNEFLA